MFIDANDMCLLTGTKTSDKNIRNDVHTMSNHFVNHAYDMKQIFIPNYMYFTSAQCDDY